ncbi:MAG: hypothetical protein WC350_00065 [Candidatus Micrarchaeia archaeon]|jgi:hypothetical protein
MTNDIRVLSRERFVRMKDADSLAPKTNRRGRRTLTIEARRHAKLLEASRMRIVGQKDAHADSAKEGQEKGGLREEIAKTDAPAGYTRRNGILVSLGLALELAAAAACGGIVEDEPDTDAATDAAEVDAEEDAPTEDAQPDESVGPDADVEEADAEDEGSMDEATDAPDVIEDGDAEEGGGCEPTTYPETRPAEAAGFLCGIPKQKIMTIQLTEYPAECGIPRATSLESIVFRVLGALPADLTCARGEETEGLNPGIYLIVGLTPAELQMGIKLASGVGTHPSSSAPIVRGGMYGLGPRDIIGAYVRCDLYDSTDTFLRRIDVWDTNTSAIDFDNAAMSWGISIPYASIGLVRTPLFVAAHGGTVDYEGLGDEGRFEVRIRIDGAGSDETWGFYRIRTKK